eukprot:Transcript_20515.p1 GENE.Transcript_20515~~Transcript_20515.p1  ORF type:complete len:385 (-),score=108.46 Transcript_20515:248-1402(-)
MTRRLSWTRPAGTRRSSTRWTARPTWTRASRPAQSLASLRTTRRASCRRRAASRRTQSRRIATCLRSRHRLASSLPKPQTSSACTSSNPGRAWELTPRRQQQEPTPQAPAARSERLRALLLTHARPPGSAQCLAATLQPGTSLVASGYCLYSSSTFFALTLGAGVQIFTLDTQIGEFVLTHPNVKIPERGAIYSMNEANRPMWDQPLRSYIEDIQSGQGESGKAYSSRYIGSMVGDVHRTLLYGGVFGYPADAKNRNGKIRLLYEAAPMAYLVEQAGGLATTGKTRIMDLVPQNVHQRVPVILGSPDDVKECRRYYDAFTASATMDGSDEAKAIRARCFTRLTPGQLVDTTMTKEPDSIALDTTGDGTVDKVVPIEDKDKYMKK